LVAVDVYNTFFMLQALQTELLLQNSRHWPGDSNVEEDNVVKVTPDNLLLSVQGSVSIHTTHCLTGGAKIRRRSSLEKAGVASLGATLNSAIVAASTGDLSRLLAKMKAETIREDGVSAKTTPLSLMEVLKCVEQRRRRENQENRTTAASCCSHVIGQLASRTLALRYLYD